ncbi:ribonuclease P/MRP protein subunit POP3 [Alternaria panax]|uniref:Ribonuclease P/MRP protein subunit POP3 n=1 Tax=Alternaria panax TaxID=48097 RepID=A0AAD4I5A1_9PLEO|nr:ribonuclease P/MRP protein subunit POP3 [Alternaria panax]
MAPAKQNAKPVFKTSSPFTETKWPEIPREDEEVILELLCNLIAPLGDHRRIYIHPSNGKKRKRHTKPNDDNSAMVESAPAVPDIGKHLLIGLNSVTRYLQGLAAGNAPSAVPVADQESTQNGPEQKDTPKSYPEEACRRLSMVIITHPKPSLSPAHAHLPTLIHLATLTPPSTLSSTSQTATRLIPVQTSADHRLASHLHIPRVGALAIYEGAPGAETLETYVREHVGPTECKWIDEAMGAEWKGLNVKSEIPVPK